MEPKTDKRFHNLTSEQMQALDKVLTEVIPIYGRGNFPTLELRAKDIIRVVRDRLVEREIHVRDIRLNGATASHVMVRGNGMGYRDLDIIFGVELPRLEDFQVIKEVVLGSLRDFLPGGVNRRKITCLTMKEAYVQKMVKVFNEHDRWSLISLSNNRAKTVGLRFVSSLRRQFEFSVDSFQIILDRMLESYWETEQNQGGKLRLNNENVMNLDVQKTTARPQQATPSECLQGDKGKDSKPEEKQCQDENVTVLEEDLSQPVADSASEEHRPENENVGAQKVPDDVKVNATKDIIAEVKGELRQIDSPSGSSAKNVVIDPLVEGGYPTLQNIDGELSESKASQGHTEKSGQRKVVQLQYEETKQYKAEGQSSTVVQESQLEFSFPPPAKKTCSMSQDVVPDYCPSPKLQRKMSRKLLSKPPPSEKWSLLADLTDITTQMFQPIEIPKATHPNQPSVESVQCLDLPDSAHTTSVVAESVLNPTCHPATTFKDGSTSTQTAEQTVKPKHYRKPLKPKGQSDQCTAISSIQLNTALDQKLGPTVSSPNSTEPWERAGGNPPITVQAECMYGDFEMAMDHLRLRVIATHNPEEIRGGGLLKYSDLLVRNFKPASETEIKSLERYMCSRFFIDFPDVTEQQRKIEAYLQCHFFGNEETSKYDYLMTLRRVIDESTVCLMGHERRQTLNMITVLALRVLGEQNAIPNTANVTCFYQPAPYMTEPIFSSYYIPQPQPPPLVYHPYPLQVHMQTGLV